MSRCGYDRVTTLLLDGGHPGPIRCCPHQKGPPQTATPFSNGLLGGVGRMTVPPSKSDICRTGWHGSFVPRAEIFLLFSHPPSEQHHSRPERRCNYRRHYPAAE